MNQRTREKIALIVFGVLLVFAAVVLLGYFTTSRSWSVAASFADDTVGSLEGYTVVVYQGVVAEDEEKPAENSAPPDAAASDEAAGDAAGEQLPDDSQDVAADGAATDQPGDSVSDSAGAPPEDSSEQAAGVDAEAVESTGSDKVSGLLPNVGASVGSDIASLFSRIVNAEDSKTYVSDVRMAYSQKQAEVLTIDVAHAERYAELQILYVGNKKVGVYSTEVYLTKTRLERYLDYFEDEGVDIVIGIAPRVSMFGTLKGTDVAIVTTKAEGVSTHGYQQDDTLVVASPDTSDVGAILFSTNNVPSARVISS